MSSRQLLVLAMTIVLSSSALAGGIDAPSSPTRQPCPGSSRTILKKEQALRLAKQYLLKQHPDTTFAALVASRVDELCGWVVTATREPEQPGGGRILLVGDTGKVLEDQGGK